MRQSLGNKRCTISRLNRATNKYDYINLTGEVTIEIDVEALGAKLASAAFKNKSGVATLAHGLIRVVVVGRKEVA